MEDVEDVEATVLKRNDLNRVRVWLSQGSREGWGEAVNKWGEDAVKTCTLRIFRKPYVRVGKDH